MTTKRDYSSIIFKTAVVIGALTLVSAARALYYSLNQALYLSSENTAQTNLLKSQTPPNLESLTR